jgi:predicted transposase YdaD
MLLTEWNQEEYLEYMRKEGYEEQRELEKESIREIEKLRIAKILISKGLTPEFVQEITGLSLEEIERN